MEDMDLKFCNRVSKFKMSDSKAGPRVSHPGSGSDRTFASARQVTALAMLYIGRLVTCGIDYSFT